MRADQVERMAALSIKLADRVLDEADPDTWPGAGKPLAQVSQQDRGDAYWCKKNAAATLALLSRITQLQMDWRLRLTPPGDKEPEDEDDLEGEIQRAERKAAELVDRALRKASRKRSDDAPVGKKH